MGTKSRFKVTFYGRNLKLLNPDLFECVVKESDGGLHHYHAETDELVDIDANKLDTDTKDQLMAAMFMMAKMPPPGSMAENETFNQAQLEIGKRDAVVNLQRMTTERDKAAAIARLDAYEREQGLLSSSAQNVREIRNFIESSFSLPEKLRGYWSVQTVDLAIGYLRREGKLEFRKAAPAAPVVPAPAETLGTLPDGSRQLPIALPCPSSATLEQAKDYLKRIRAVQQPGVVHAEGFKAALR